RQVDDARLERHAGQSVGQATLNVVALVGREDELSEPKLLLEGPFLHFVGGIHEEARARAVHVDGVGVAGDREHAASCGGDVGGAHRKQGGRYIAAVNGIVRARGQAESGGDHGASSTEV